MIVITGATGQLGSLIVVSLLERVPAEEVGVSVRDPGRAADLAEAAAIILADPGRFDGPTPPLTALDPSDLEDVADILSKLTGRTIPPHRRRRRRMGRRTCRARRSRGAGDDDARHVPCRAAGRVLRHQPNPR